MKNPYKFKKVNRKSLEFEENVRFKNLKNFTTKYRISGKDLEKSLSL